MVRPHAKQSDLRANRTQNLKLVPVTLVQSRDVGDRIKERNAWYRRKTYEAPDGAVQVLACGCSVFVARGEMPECPMHGVDSQRAA